MKHPLAPLIIMFDLSISNLFISTITIPSSLGFISWLFIPFSAILPSSSAKTGSYLFSCFLNIHLLLLGSKIRIIELLANHDLLSVVKHDPLQKTIPK